MDFQAVISGLIASHPALVGFVLMVGSLRLVLHPAMTAIQKLTAETPWTWDDELVGKILNSKAWALFAFAVDYIGSIKVPMPPSTVPLPAPLTEDTNSVRGNAE